MTIAVTWGIFCGVEGVKPFVKSPCALHHWQPETDKRNVEVAPSWKISADAHGVFFQWATELMTSQNESIMRLVYCNDVIMIK